MPESFFGSMQIELLDTRAWATRLELASANFEWIEAWYSPARHSAMEYHVPTRRCTSTVGQGGA